MYKMQEEKMEVPLNGMLAEFREALRDEIEKVKSSGISTLLLRSGCPLESNGKGYWYRFIVEYAPTLPADTPCKLTIAGNKYDVTVVSAGDNSIIIASDILLPDNIGFATLENGSTILMEKLIKCIEDNSEKSNPTGNRMLTPDGNVYHSKKLFSYKDLQLKESNTTSQSRAVEEALTNDITYIWGPPGTGKTTVIGQIIDELYKHERSVLVVSHTNTAVDGAIDKADQSYSASHNKDTELYPILRLGTPARSIPERATLDSHVKALGKELYEQKQVLEDEQRSLQDKTRELRALIGKWMWIEHSDLEDARKFIDDLNKIEVNYEELDQELNELKKEIAAEKEANPNAVYYNTLCQRRDTLQNDLATLASQVDKFNRKISNNKENIRKAEDELRKCDKYAEMKAYREKEFMSEEFYNEQIENLGHQIEENNASITKLEDEATDVQNQINAYEQRGSIGRLFANGNAYTRNKNRVAEIEQEKQVLIEETDRIESVRSEQRSILGNLLQYEKQMQLYAPSQDKNTWERLINGYKIEISEYSFEIDKLKKKETETTITLDKLAPQIEAAKASYEIISELQQRFYECETKFGELRRKKRSLQESTKTILDKELTTCAQYFAIDRALLDSGVNDLFNELESKLEQAKKDIEAVDISEAIREKDQISIRLDEITTDLADINSKLSDLERQAIMGAKILGTTLAKSYLDSTLRERTFDTVILDEASMASIPALWCASYLAGTSIIIVGDFLQLSPIVLAETDLAKKWLGTDIFYLSGMQELAKDRATCPKNFVMLNDQFRMESDIAEIANMYYGAYGGLRSNDDNEYRNKKRAEFHEWYNGEVSSDHVHLIDTESLNAWASAIPQGLSKSRLNTFSATVDVDMAFGFIEKILKELDPATAKPSTEPKVLIVAPYKAHIKLIHKLIDLGYESRGFKDNLGLIRAGTVHSFQGNEAEIVIFDLVVDEPHFRANLFMPDDEVDGDQKKLFNVAVTRAKFELFIVGDFKFMQQRAKNNALGALLDMLINIKRLQKIDVNEFLPNLVFSRPTSAHFKGDINNCQIICKETDYLEYLQRDIATFKNRMIIYSPFITERRLADLLPFFADAVNQGRKIAVVTKDISERGKRELESYKKCERELTALGVEVIHKKGMHEKLVFVDSDAVWVGSLNSLSFTGETGEIMHRLGDKGITAEYEKIYNIAHIGSVVENPYEHRCPVCGGDMILKEGRKGSPYWECENEDYKRNVDRQYPVDGYLRCSCGAIYKFSMKNEPRWVCSENPNHSHRKISYYDLKLEKMYALIPRGDRKAVKEYFAKKQAEKEAEKAEKEKEKKKTTKSSSKSSAKKSTSKNTKTKGSSKTKKKEEKPEQKGTEQMTLLDL